MGELSVPEFVDLPILRGLRELYSANIIGQERALNEVVDSFSTAMAGLNPPGVPLVVLLFPGPSGVGKTEAAKLVGRFFYQKQVEKIREHEARVRHRGEVEKNHRLASFTLPELVRVDCGSYGGGMEHSVIELVGAPPSYVGYGELPILSEYNFPPGIVRVLLLDELEKAFVGTRHGGTGLTGILMPLLREAAIRNRLGQEVAFESTIIIATSNFGSQAIWEEATRHPIGFRQDRKERKGFHLGAEEVEVLNENIYRMINDQLWDPRRTPFRLEFLNRFDRVVVFRFLTRDEYRRILDKEIAALNHEFAMGSGGAMLRLTPAAKEWILGHGIDFEKNVPSLLRFFKRKVREPMAKLLLGGVVKAGDIVEAYPGSDDDLAFRTVESDLGKDKRKK